MIKLAGVRCPLDAVARIDFHREQRSGVLVDLAARHLGVSARSVESARVLRRSVDARKRGRVAYVLSIAVSLESRDAEDGLLRSGKAEPYIAYEPLDIPVFDRCPERPVVVGLGPAGLFAGLYLARAGMRPLVVERGADVRTRRRIVRAFEEGADLDPRTNIQFGEGGAGAFSDGKLTTGTKHPMAPHVLRWLVDAGAPADIAIDAKPHIGSDLLPAVVERIRRQMCALGAEVRFETRLADIELEDGSLRAAVLEGPDGSQSRVPASRLILACGHSARDTFSMLLDRGVRMERKPFSMGVRIEHLQSDVDESRYGSCSDCGVLPPAEYKLAVHPQGRRSAYTFCMCPGGTVVCASSEEGCLVTNGMSEHARAGRNANAALLVNVDPDDFGGEDPLAGVRFQQRVERAAFDAAIAAGGAPYSAPAQTVGDFLAGRSGTASGRVEPSFPRGVVWTDLHDVLPPFVSSSIEAALPELDRRQRGFASPDAVMTAPETRSSSPVRICRNEGLQAYLDGDGRRCGIGVYPCGEGPGFAGGIMSAASDGLRIARRVLADAQEDCELEEAAAALRAGRCVLFPTDTVYGLGVAVLHADSPEELFRLKGRPQGKPVAWLVGGLADLDVYGRDVPDVARRLAAAFWPGPLTVVVRASHLVPAAFLGGGSTIGLRMPDCEQARRLIDKAGCPIAATSANLSGQPPASSLDDVPDALRGAVAVCVGGNVVAGGVASTVVDCSDGCVRILREGAVSSADIQSLRQEDRRGGDCR